MKCAGKAEAIIAKQRSGPTGIVSLAFDDELTRFSNFAKPAAAPEVAAQPQLPKPPPKSSAPPPRCADGEEIDYDDNGEVLTCPTLIKPLSSS